MRKKHKVGADNLAGQAKEAAEVVEGSAAETTSRTAGSIRQELSQPISGTQSTEKPHCKLKGKCVKRAPSRVKVWNLLAGATDELQVVDAGMGAEIKRLVALEQEIWMQVPVWGARDSYCLRFRT